MGLFNFLKGGPKTAEKPVEKKGHKPVETSSGNKVVVLGLDGFSSSLLSRLMAAGRMPRCAAIRKQGSLVPMATPFPEDTAVAWAEFMTGVNAGKNGVFGHEDLTPASYRTHRPEATHVRPRTLWDILGEQGKRAVVVNAPVTWPVKEMAGVLISGAPGAKLQEAVHPKSLVPTLEKLGYPADAGAPPSGETPAALMQAVRTRFEKRRKAIAHLWEHETWDLFVAAISETETLRRAFWAASEDPSHPDHGFLMEWYELVDAFIGEMYDRTKSLGGSPAFMLMSDYGFAEAKTRFFVNAWLREKGYLSFVGWPPASLEEIADGTAAFCLDSGRIYLNTQGKYPRGCVSPGEEYDRVRAEIAYGLLDLTVNGEHVIEKIYTKEDLFSGPFSKVAPDLIAVAESGFELDGAIDHEEQTQMDVVTGVPSRDDAIFFINRLGIVSGKPRVRDIAPTVLDLLEIPANGMDGASLVRVAAVGN
jgi:predicted AlkP superfamily phosphohydrolase/phosphomutase